MGALMTEALLLRPWRAGDVASLAKHANSRNVSDNLADRFPHPYTERDASEWIAFASKHPYYFAIEVGGEAVGSVGVEPGQDIYRRTAELGYWIGEAYWGRGLVTQAVRQVTEHAFPAFDLTRIFARPFARNLASARVLEKAGYALESVARHSAVKGGEVLDQRIYVRTR
jgi:[ribosomal protein S5]-alanine N-acetyltransferase